MTDPTVWSDLRSAFNQLAFKYGDRLRPSWTSTPRNDAGDHWYVFRPDTDDADRERNRFILLAKRAGALLGGGGQVDPLFAWLDHLRTKSANFMGGHAEGDVGGFEFGTIEHPCQASAECCLDLETDAMARARREALNSGALFPSSESLDSVIATPKKRGRRADLLRRKAISNAMSKHGESWREHLPEIFEELDNQAVALGTFQGMEIDLGDGQSTVVAKWEDLELAQGDQRAKVIDALRKYL